MPKYINVGMINTGDTVTTDATMGYPWVADTVEITEFAAPTADAVLASVGDDPAKAQVELEREQAREQPRKTLVTKLQKIAEGPGA